MKLKYKLTEFLYKLSYKRANFFFAIYNKIPFLEWLLHSLCELEMTFKLLLDKEFKLELDTMNVLHKSSDMTEWQEIIPKNTDYCGSCKFKAYSKLAEFFFGHQSNSYCYYLGKGDFSYYNPTRLLFDGCKECVEFMWDGEDE